VKLGRRVISYYRAFTFNKRDCPYAIFATRYVFTQVLDGKINHCVESDLYVESAGETLL
jgi:glutaredoxin